jgi:hypothetical protein
VNVDDGSGFLIDHSYPKAPWSLFGNNKKWNPGFIQEASPNTGQFQRAQHAVCVSFPASM